MIIIFSFLICCWFFGIIDLISFFLLRPYAIVRVRSLRRHRAAHHLDRWAGSVARQFCHTQPAPTLSLSLSLSLSLVLLERFDFNRKPPLQQKQSNFELFSLRSVRCRRTAFQSFDFGFASWFRSTSGRIFIIQKRFKRDLVSGLRKMHNFFER